MHTSLTQRSRSGLTMPLSRYSVGTYPETSSNKTCQETFGHSRLNSHILMSLANKLPCILLLFLLFLFLHLLLLLPLLLHLLLLLLHFLFFLPLPSCLSSLSSSSFCLLPQPLLLLPLSRKASFYARMPVTDLDRIPMLALSTGSFVSAPRSTTTQ